ncbi:hypothetical protein JTE90_006312 [Oedothorax gibbosus]|uniref:Pre-C2HC domain-containing protein n=1 Tax=Oedothorax gibbosus TaxID=931172 RepID=A0AAV6U2K2_9ARAC|nr:hypothetical protein JTE90_006312 [Oedothorax gibbosus]
MPNPTPILNFHQYPINEKLEILNNPSTEKIPTREAVIQQLIAANNPSSNDCQTAGAELPCTVVPPGGNELTNKPLPLRVDDSQNPSLPATPTPSIEDSTNYEASSASNASNNDQWKKMPNRFTAKRKHQSSNAPDFEHPNKYKISDENSETDDDIEIDDPFQPTTTGPTSRIPPFIITNPQFNWIQFRKKIKSSYPEEQFTGKANGENFKLQMKTPNGYRLICSMLKNDGIQFSTYGFKDQNPLKAVIRNIPADIPTDEILAELKEQNIPVQRVHQLKKTVGAEKIPLPIYFVDVDRSDEGKKIYNVTEILNIKINVTSYKKGDNITQCHRCQRYGHGQNNCNNAARCVKCAGPHHTRECLHKTKMDTPKCALCGGPHTANYRQCPKRPITVNRQGDPPQLPQPPAAPQPRTTSSQASTRIFPQVAIPSTSTAKQANQEIPTANAPTPNAWTRHPFIPRQVTLNHQPQPSVPPANTSSSPEPSFDFKSLLNLFKKYWIKFQNAKDIMTKFEVGLEALQEVITTFDHE